MSGQRKLPGVPSMVPRKYHHEIQCVMQKFQADIVLDILKYANLDDDAFVRVGKFLELGTTPTGVLKIIKDVPGNSVVKRLYEIRTKEIE